ncbi:MAG TPA: extracellular solute-binding protein [Blastocatellia bacterium]|nr:extracellular solute-binding protein [Blastocatellia bacterium]
MSKTRPKRTASLLALTATAVYAFLYAPILILVALSFNSSRFSTIWQGFTLKWYALAFRDSELIGSLRVSLVVALSAAAVATAIGTAAALALGRNRFRMKRAAETLVFMPVIIPEIIVGFATAAFFGFAGVALGVSTVIATHVAFSISYVVFVVRARVAGLDPSMEEAAMDLGATPWQTFSKITFPMILPGVISAALLVFTISLDDYLITSFVAGPGATTLPLKIYSMVKTGVTPEINAISGVLLAVTLVLVIVSERVASGKLSRWHRAAAAGALVLLASFAIGGRAHTPGGGELNVFIWSNYLPDDVIKQFEDQYHAHVNVELYDSNEALLAKLQSGAVDYDIVVPSDYMVKVLREQGLLQQVNRDSLTNFSNLDPKLVGLPFDPQNEYSAPYLWGTTGIGYRKDKVTGVVDSWAIMFDARYKDRLAMLDDVREVFGATLKLEGESLNDTNPDDIARAAELLKRQKALLRAYDSGGFDQLLLSGDAWIVQGYNGQIAKAMIENPNIGYVLPKEGCTVAVDNMCIPSKAPHAALANEFMNFVLRARVAADIANATGYSSPNLAARAFIRKDLLDNPAVYPSAAALQKCEFITDLGPAVTVYDRYWTEVKSQ